jgi:hypothetical protein
MYESMKPKDAARVFDRLEMGVLIEIATQIAPRKMSDIMGLMQSEAAERLTVEMARRAGTGGGGERAADAGDLPKIEGRLNWQNLHSMARAGDRRHGLSDRKKCRQWREWLPLNFGRWLAPWRRVCGATSAGRPRSWDVC